MYWLGSYTVWEKSVGIFWNSGTLSPDLTRLSITLALGPFIHTYPTCLALTSLGVDWLQDLIMFLEKQLFCPCFSIKCLRSVGLDLFGVTIPETMVGSTSSLTHLSSSLHNISLRTIHAHISNL